MQRYLVTGAAGYVGREVVAYLLGRGEQVAALDLSVPELGSELIRVDLTDKLALDEALAGRSFDRILHIASLPGDTGDPIEMIRVNVGGCLNMLEIARKAGVKRFVLTSSISALGWFPATPFAPPDHLPVDEHQAPRPEDIYSSTKLMQEILARTYFKQYGVPTTVLRLTAVIGPRGRGGGGTYRVMAEALAKGERVQVPHMTSEELCHYVDVRDVARMQVVLAEHPEAVGEVFFCAGPRAVTGQEFADTIRSIVPGIAVEFGYPWSMAQGGRLCFSMDKAKNVLGFEPKYALEDSIRNIVDWARTSGLSV